jgi:tetratricopeptide (TPR) repeat protein
MRIGLGPATRSGGAVVENVTRLVRAELAATLMRFRTFTVIDLDMAQGPTDFVLDLTAGTDAGHLLLMAVVTATDTGAVILTDRWEGLSENWLTIQAALVRRLSAALSLEISRERLGRITTANFGKRAFDTWLEGNMHLDRFTEDGMARAAACFDTVIDLAPGTSMGHSSLARLKNGQHLMLPGYVRRAEDHQAALDLATRAVQLDPLDSRAHLHRAWALALLGMHEKAEAGFHMARTCNPNDPWTVLSSALGAAFGGHADTAAALSAQVIANNWTIAPFQWGFHAPIRFLAGDLEGCVSAAEACGEAIINVPAWKAAALWHLGQQDTAAAAWQVFAHRARAGWIGPDAPRDADLRDWFVSLFPIADAGQRARLAAGASGAAGLP